MRFTRERSTAQAVHASYPRQLCESLVCLAVAVIMFRSFEVEGYMITTGSMAPFLLGYHKRVECPTCGYHFAFGIAYDAEYGQGESHSAHAEDADIATPESGSMADPGGNHNSEDRLYAVCPNCDQAAIDISGVPRNQGDQLLVNKNAFLFRRPKRWEVVVFRNPIKPTQAYVKRLLGLPGETIEVRRGDVFIDGKLQRKGLDTQRAIRIPVYDFDYQPRDKRKSEPHWLVEEGTNNWENNGNGFLIDQTKVATGGDTSAAAEWAWLRYRHWLRSGGSHKTTVALERLPDDVEMPVTSPHSLRYDPIAKVLSCAGVLSDSWRDRLLAMSTDAAFNKAVESLAENSHVAPVSDTYGYNRSIGGIPTVPVRDLMLAVELTAQQLAGEVRFEMSDGGHSYSCTLNLAERTARLAVDAGNESLRSAQLTPEDLQQPILVEMSLMDRQVLVAVNGRPIFPAWEMPDEESEAGPSLAPVRIGSRGAAVRVGSLRLFRDVFYTERPHLQQQKLGSDEYYMLGDNSPVSLDSRSWPSGAVNSQMFLGKPFVVHLPSLPAKVKIGRWTTNIRIPDLSRIRYID